MTTHVVRRHKYPRLMALSSFNFKNIHRRLAYKLNLPAAQVIVSHDLRSLVAKTSPSISPSTPLSTPPSNRPPILSIMTTSSQNTYIGCTLLPPSNSPTPTTTYDSNSPDTPFSFGGPIDETPFSFGGRLVARQTQTCIPSDNNSLTNYSSIKVIAVSSVVSSIVLFVIVAAVIWLLVRRRERQVKKEMEEEEKDLKKDRKVMFE